MIRRLWLVVAASLTLGITVSPANARPPYKRALADHFGKFLPKKLNDCRTCHLTPNEAKAVGVKEEKPHNSFGARLKVVRQQLKKAGKPSSIIDAIEAIADEDSDGDGVTNMVELLTGHFPGDKNDTPTPVELAKAKLLAAEFAKTKSGYLWRPYEKVARPTVPVVKNLAWVTNPIDAFIAAEHEALGLKPRPLAPKAVLLRRVYLDLIGLPPTPAELHAFLADNSPNAYEKVVDRLLASPQYGERWGRHWMDIWRYSDWAGYGAEIRDSQPHIWRWRDWIIENLNADTGYDQMILEMLAADELYPSDTNKLRATGYLVRNFKSLSREKWMQDCVEHTSMAFLATTLKCAKCHDHMYDPITQNEYYQFRAIFEPYKVRIDPLPGALDPKLGGLVRAFDADLKAPTYFFIRGDDRTPDKKKVIIPGVPEALGGIPFEIAPSTLPPPAYAPEKQDFVYKELVANSAALVKKAKDAAETAAKKGAAEAKLAEFDVKIAQAKHNALEAVLEAEKLEDAGKKDLLEWKGWAMSASSAQHELPILQAERAVEAAEQALAALKAKKDDKQLAAAEKNLAKAKGDYTKLLIPAFSLNTKFQPRDVKSYPKTSTGRRTALAKWLASKENPLVARVAVNHIWLRHFGRAIVPSVFEFGRNGQLPSHAALLDWLAAEFMTRGWSMKALHRQIVMSSTYRQASTPDAANAKLDPDNKHYWRYQPHSVEAEVVRNLVFFVSGKLELTMGGKEIPYTQGMSVSRRSIYFQHAAEKEMEFLQIFDGPNVTECYERKPAIVPQQALALYNNDLVRKHARLLARDLTGQVKGDAKTFVTLAYEHVLCRAPTDAEITTCLTFLQQQTKIHADKKTPPAPNWADGSAAHPDPEVRAREQLVHVLMNHHEFVTIR